MLQKSENNGTEEIGLVTPTPGFNTSTHLSQDKMAAISQTIFSDAFSWMKTLYFDQNFTEVCS